MALQLATSLIDKNPKKPMKALWEALSQKKPDWDDILPNDIEAYTYPAEVAMAIVSHPSCGLEHRYTPDEGGYWDFFQPQLQCGVFYGFTPLILAATANRFDVLQALVEAGADLSAADKSHTTTLQMAAAHGNVAAIQFLLIKGAKVTHIERTSSPLHRAVMNGHVQALTILIEAGGSLDWKDSMGHTPLHCASLSGHVSAVELLLLKGANASEADTTSGMNPLHWAAARGHAEVSKVLARAGDVNATKADGSTALHLAAERGHVEVIQVLVAEGADLEIKDELGQTPIFLACWINSEAVDFLISAGANVNCKCTTKGKTPLHTVAERGSSKSVRAIVDAGADVDAVDAYGYTTLWYAHASGWSENAEVLLAEGASAPLLRLIKESGV